MTLQLDTQKYLSEITSKPAFDEISLGKQKSRRMDPNRHILVSIIYSAT